MFHIDNIRKAETDDVLTARSQVQTDAGNSLRYNRTVIGLTAGLGLLVVMDPSVLTVIIGAVSEAYLAVSTFVAATLLIFFSLEKILNIDLTETLRHSGRWQVVIAALLGALPGCGGAIIVLTRYVSGSLSFGAVLATLTATMGDAAFLLIAKEPATGALIMGLGFAVGSITGYIVDAIHGPDFMRPENSQKKTVTAELSENADISSRTLDRLWLLVLIPGVIVGVLQAFQIDVDSFLGTIGLYEPSLYLGFFGGLLCVTMFVLPRILTFLPRNNTAGGSPLRRTISDTNFVTSWVVFAFLAYEISVHLLNIDLGMAFGSVAALVPLLAVLVGFIPGCGPQILVTSLYLSGIIPLSALVGNAISNDGDALFPAIALAPRTAIVATLYSAVPALVISYSWYLLEG